MRVKVAFRWRKKNGKPIFLSTNATAFFMQIQDWIFDLHKIRSIRSHYWTFLFHATPPRSQRTDYQG
jgi:hypothetical protein